MFHSRRIGHSSKFVSAGHREEAVSGRSPPSAFLAWFECPLQASKGAPLSVWDRALPVFHTYSRGCILFPCCSLGPLPPLVARPALPLASTEASETRGLWATTSVPRWWRAQQLAARGHSSWHACGQGRASGWADRDGALHSRECSAAYWLPLRCWEVGRHGSHWPRASITPGADSAHLAFLGGTAQCRPKEVSWVLVAVR